MTTGSVSDLSLSESTEDCEKSRPHQPPLLLLHPQPQPQPSTLSRNAPPTPPGSTSNPGPIQYPQAAHYAAYPLASGAAERFSEKPYSLSATSSWQSEAFKLSLNKPVKGKLRGGHRDRRSPKAATDEEKASRSRSISMTHNASMPPSRISCPIGYLEEEYETVDVEQHLGNILVYLALFAPFIAWLLSLYAVLAIALSAMSAPVYIYTTRKSFSDQVITFVAPALLLQLRMIYSPFTLDSQPRAWTLSLVALSSPVYAIGISIASWVAAVFWFYAAILGEPNQDGARDRDGRNAVRGVRAWWERWLLVGLNPHEDA